MKQILITKVKDTYGVFSLMSPHSVTYNGQELRTAEALFQFERFEKFPEVQAEIIAQKSPMGAKMKARLHREKLGRGINWDEAPEDIPLMKKCMLLKLEQHPEIREKLIATGNAEIIEDCTTHDRESARFWGKVYKGGKWIGENMLGKLWMEIRAELGEKISRTNLITSVGARCSAEKI